MPTLQNGSKTNVSPSELGRHPQVNKMHGSMNPNGRDMIIDGCVSIRRRVTRGFWKERHRKELLEQPSSGRELTRTRTKIR